MPSERVPSVGGSSSSRRGKGPVHVIERLEMSSGRGPDIGGSLSNRQGEGPMPAVETLEKPSE